MAKILIIKIRTEIGKNRNDGKPEILLKYTEIEKDV